MTAYHVFPAGLSRARHRHQPIIVDRSAPDQFGYSSRQVLARLQDIYPVTYRMLDGWMRTGAVGLVLASGSGSRRRFSEDELAALRRWVQRYAAVVAEAEVVMSGAAWAELVATQPAVKSAAGQSAPLASGTSMGTDGEPAPMDAGAGTTAHKEQQP